MISEPQQIKLSSASILMRLTATKLPEDVSDFTGYGAGLGHGLRGGAFSWVKGEDLFTG